MYAFVTVSYLFDAIVLYFINYFDAVFNFTLNLGFQKLLSFFGVQLLYRVKVDSKELAYLDDNLVVLTKLKIMQ